MYTKSFEQVNEVMLGISYVVIKMYELFAAQAAAAAIVKAPVENPKYIRVQDVADLFNVVPRTVYRWLKKGFILATYIGGMTRFDKAVLVEHVIANKANKKIR